MFGVGNFLVKFCKVFIGEVDSISFTFWRTAVLIPIAYYNMKSKNEEIIKFQNLNNKAWFIIRCFANYCSLITFILSLSYIRLSTANCIIQMNPVLTVFLSIVILKEKFYPRYAIGVLVGFIGSFMIISYDKSSHNSISINLSDNNFDIFCGVFFAALAMIGISFLVVINKIILKEKIYGNNQIFYIGITNTIFSLIIIIF